jgi:altronate hydrolase
LAREQVLQLHPDDNVAVALLDLPVGATVSPLGRSVVLATAVPAKHKFALRDIPVDETVIMYGVKVGKAMRAIQAGEVVTTRNLHHETAPFHEKTEGYKWSAPDVTKWKNATFGGYRRQDGQVGTRNYWLVVPLVFCENRNIGVLKQAFEQELGFAQPPLYQQQVADLVRLYESGRTEQIGDYVETAKE